MADTADKAPAVATMTAAQLAWFEDFLGAKPPVGAVGTGSAAPSGGGDAALQATDTDVFFDKDSSQLTTNDRHALERYAQAYIAATSTEPITIQAWASQEGDEKH